MKRACGSDPNQKMVYYDSLSLDIVGGDATKQIFQKISQLCLPSLFACACVCKEWYQIVDKLDIWPDVASYDDVEIIDASDWEKVPNLSDYGISAKDEPSVNRRTFFLTYKK